MVCGEFKDWTPDEPEAQTSEAEKVFLKDLYSYMKKRGSPIERIPNLGFKQSNSTVYTCPITNGKCIYLLIKLILTQLFGVPSQL